MRLTQKLIDPLFTDMHPVHYACLLYRIRCVAHRLIEFGYESFVNSYSPRELLAMAALLPDRQHDILVREAFDRADATLGEWINAHCPDLLVEA